MKISKEILYKLYIKKELNQSEISRIFNCSQQTISNYLTRCNIQKRNMSSINKKRFENSENHPRYIDGRTKTQHFCISCGNKVSITSFRGTKNVSLVYLKG